MKDPTRKVIGYFAIRKGSANMLCDGDALVIAGSAQLMTRYISKLAEDSISKYKVKKTRYDEIMHGMRLGGVYTFDKVAYNKFLPLLKSEDKYIAEVKLADDPKPHPEAVRLMRVSWNDIIS